MSWSETFRDQRLGDLASLQPSNDLTRKSIGQFQAAVNAAQTLIMSGELGSPRDKDTYFNIHMNGHENENHVPPPGWAADIISLSVSRTNQRDSE